MQKFDKKGNHIQGIDRRPKDPTLLYEINRQKMDFSQFRNVKYSWNPLAEYCEYGRQFRTVMTIDPLDLGLDESTKVEEEVHERQEPTRFKFVMKDPKNTTVWFQANEITWPDMLEALYFWSERAKVLNNEARALNVGQMGWFYIPEYRKAVPQKALDLFLNHKDSDFHKKKWKPSFLGLPGTRKIVFRYVVTDDDGPVWPIKEAIGETLFDKPPKPIVELPGPKPGGFRALVY